MIFIYIFLVEAPEATDFSITSPLPITNTSSQPIDWENQLIEEKLAYLRNCSKLNINSDGSHKFDELESTDQLKFLNHEIYYGFPPGKIRNELKDAEAFKVNASSRQKCKVFEYGSCYMLSWTLSNGNEIKEYFNECDFLRFHGSQFILLYCAIEQKVCVDLTKSSDMEIDVEDDQSILVSASLSPNFKVVIGNSDRASAIPPLQPSIDTELSVVVTTGSVLGSDVLIATTVPEMTDVFQSENEIEGLLFI